MKIADFAVRPVAVLIFCLLFLTLLLPSAIAASSTSGVWEPPSMPSWAVPAAFAILIGVYTLIIFEAMHLTRERRRELGRFLTQLRYTCIADCSGHLATWARRI